MMPKCPVLNMDRKVHLDKQIQIHVDVDTRVSFVIQSEQVSESLAISMSRHVNSLCLVQLLM